MNRLIAIAAGHGGGDPGAIGQNSTEAQEAIQITARVVDRLKADGRFSVYHVSDSLGLAAEINDLNAHYKNGDGVAFEVHKNAGGGHGCQVYYLAGDGGALDHATKLSQSLADVTGLPNRGARPDNEPALVARLGGPLGWTRNVNMESYLIEAGFQDSDSISDDADERFAEGIYEGILKIYGLGAKAIPAPPAPAQDPWADAIPIDIAIEVTAKNLLVRETPHTTAASGVGVDANGQKLNGDGNLLAGDVVTVKAYIHSDDVDLSAKGGAHTDLWGKTPHGKAMWLGGTDFAERLALKQTPAPVVTPPPVPAAPEPSPLELFFAKFNIAELPGGPVEMYARAGSHLVNLETRAAFGSTYAEGDPITVKYAAAVGSDVFYMTEYSASHMNATGFRADDLLVVRPISAAVTIPVSAPVSAPAPGPTESMDSIMPPAANTATPEQPTLSWHDRLVILLAGILAWFDKKNKDK